LPQRIAGLKQSSDIVSEFVYTRVAARLAGRRYDTPVPSLPRISYSAISGIHVRCEFLPLRSVGKDPTKQKERSSALSIGVLCHKMVLQRSGGSDPAVTCPRVDCVEFVRTPFAIRTGAGLRDGLPLSRGFDVCNAFLRFLNFSALSDESHREIERMHRNSVPVESPPTKTADAYVSREFNDLSGVEILREFSFLTLVWISMVGCVAVRGVGARSMFRLRDQTWNQHTKYYCTPFLSPRRSFRDGLAIFFSTLIHSCSTGDKVCGIANREDH